MLYCRMRLRGLRLRRQNDKNLAKKNDTHNNVAKCDFFSKCDEVDKTGRYN